MYNTYETYLCPYFMDATRYESDIMYTSCNSYNCPYYASSQINNPYFFNRFANQFKDYGPEPFVININEATRRNNTFRTALWTGNHLQLTLMSISVGEDIGLEIHPNVDQFLRIEKGQGLVKMGDRKDKLDFQQRVYDDFAIFIPAGTWHNVINTGNIPLKLYSIYAPPQHSKGTIHATKAIAQAAEQSKGQ